MVFCSIRDVARKTRIRFLLIHSAMKNGELITSQGKEHKIYGRPSRREDK